MKKSTKSSATIFHIKVTLHHINPPIWRRIQAPGDTKLGKLINGRNVRLDKIASQGDTILYTYDFRDSWEHELKIEKVLPPESGVRHPRCLEGQRACPPEDCGGPWGFENLLEVFNDPNDEEYEEMREWVGKDYDPEYFELDSVNRAMR